MGVLQKAGTQCSLQPHKSSFGENGSPALLSFQGHQTEGTERRHLHNKFTTYLAAKYWKQQCRRKRYFILWGMINGHLADILMFLSRRVLNCEEKKKKTFGWLQYCKSLAD